tara:strand:+ start:150045 stop:150842 length:798 start_codon:yes stop_codon:yes gene_type:complete
MIPQLLAIVLSLSASFGMHQNRPQIDTAVDAEVIDLSMTVNDQEYACKVVINEAAEKGGAAILFLHGYGECGTDGEKQLTVGLPKHAMENPEDWPFVLIVPQKPVFNSEWEDHEVAVLKMLDEAAEQGLYDPKRLAITGLSQGGHGTIVIGAMHTDLFKAAAPVCGYTERRISKEQQRLEEVGANLTDPAVVKAAKALSAIPTWFFHGDDDSVVPVSESRSLHTALEAIDADTHYTEVSGANHNSWDDAYTSKELMQWFRDHLSE